MAATQKSYYGLVADPETAIGQIRIKSVLLRLKGNVLRCPSFSNLYEFRRACRTIKQSPESMWICF